MTGRFGKPLARLTALAAATLLLASGCSSNPNAGYSFTSTYNTAIETVAVPVFDNATMFPGLDLMLSEAVAKEIQRSTPWRVAAPASSDTELTATITNAEYRTLSVRRGTGLTEEQAFRITVSFSWRNARTGQTIVARSGFSAAGTSIQARPTNERVEVGQREAIQELARAIVRELRAAW